MYSDVASGATACVLCGAGSESVQHGNDGAGGFKCTLCAPGSFRYVSITCKLQFQVIIHIGILEMFLFNSSEMSSCQPCLPPYYSDNAGATVCSRCIAGSQAMAPLSNVTGSVKSESCKAGWFR